MPKDVALCPFSISIVGVHSYTGVSYPNRALKRSTLKLQCRSSTNGTRHAFCLAQRTRPIAKDSDYNKEASKSHRCQQAQGKDEKTEASQESPILVESRRRTLISTLGLLGANSLPEKQAGAFPSPSLEILQESVASSSRSGGDIGISALRNPAIYRSVIYCLLVTGKCCIGGANLINLATIV